MDSSASKDVVVGMSTDKESMVDPFLVEALQNPRHRLTSLYFLLLYLFLSPITRVNLDPCLMGLF